MNEAIDPKARGSTILRWRTILGWSAAEAAERLSVTTRTLSSDESGGVVPDARWRLFVHEVTEELRRGRDSGGFVVVSADDGITPIDVVSYDNFAGFTVSDDGKTGLIASYTIDRVTGKHGIHRQLFSMASNRGLFPVIAKWEQQRALEAGDNQLLHMQHWLTRQALKGELDNPDLAGLKQNLRETQDRLLAADPGTSEYDERFDQNEAAVAALVQRMSTTR